MRPEQALATLLPEGWQSCAPLIEDGERHRLADRYRVRLDDGRLAVLRIDRPQARRLRLARSREAAALRLAAPAGLGPEVIASLPEEGVLLVHHLPGRSWGREDLQSEGGLARSAALLRHVHALAPGLPELDLAAAIRTYADVAGIDPRLTLEMLGKATAFPGTPVPCHGDPNAANIIDDGTRLRFIDWEYAGLCDAFFDLAALLGQNDLPEAAGATLLTAYLGRSPDEVEARRLEAWRRCFDAVAELWQAAVQG